MGITAGSGVCEVSIDTILTSDTGVGTVIAVKQGLILLVYLLKLE